jgi:DNA-binding transcriptional MerR regulator
MISIGDFARLGRVSVRMLRHYDALGLLRPEYVDPSSGYRYYRAAQLRRLNRIVALKDLGLQLDQVRVIVDEQVTGDQLRAMLRLRQAELEAQILEGRHRLDRVQARLRLIDAEETMTHPDVITKTVPAATVVGLTATAASATQEDVGPVVGPMYPPIMQHLAAAGVTPAGPSIAYYTPGRCRSRQRRQHAPDSIPAGRETTMPGAGGRRVSVYKAVDGLCKSRPILCTARGNAGDTGQDHHYGKAASCVNAVHRV